MYSLSKEDFRNIHNALCDVRNAQSRLSDVLNDSLSNQLSKAIVKFEQGLENVYQQDSKHFDDISEQASTIAKEYDLKTIWSVYDIKSLQDVYPHKASILSGRYNGKTVDIILEDRFYRYDELYVLIDKMIRELDDYHIFIEDIRVRDNKMYVITGS